VRLASPGSPLQAEAAAAQSATDNLTNRMGLTQTGVYMSLPIKEANTIQVIMPWRPDMLLTTPLYDVAASGHGGGSAAIHRDSNHTHHHAKLTKVDEPRLHVPPVQSPIEAKATEVQMNPHQVVQEDLLSVRVQWTQKNGGQYTHAPTHCATHCVAHCASRKVDEFVSRRHLNAYLTSLPFLSLVLSFPPPKLVAWCSRWFAALPS
jgi:hypothetical protein